LWPVFGAANQMLAALCLVVVTAWLRRRGRPVAYTLVPLVLLGLLTAWSMGLNLRDFLAAGNHLLAGVSLVLLALCAWIAAEAGLSLRRSAATP
ncbi:MAG: carbon starvation protein A, partial [Planctomycetes bacterium]|nr:carbon starvation protein A [Planctomycetota bacterium]